MAIFTVDSDRVAMSALSASAACQRIREEVASLMSDLIDLQNSWTGAAGDQCRAAVENWQATQIHVEQSLDAISAQLSAASDVYAQAESHSASLFAR